VKTPLKMTLAAALLLVSLLWMTPPAGAHDGYRYHRHRPAWSDSYCRPSYDGRNGEWERRRWSKSYRRPDRYYIN
jgi:hypothetical protein